ncbi:hypothetical protein THAOC_04442 [Thalassiosira oceanica]|uniref:Uncharacterized protein n=1 Tax=Thalassiosira oceanica TaxID=159749 RepID=K0T564_THAOC|nr:hypothetical protein THAOC_04442 [Thalassiosira oceanica]|eukprot:EJK73913.1 hypothetical protein THAOC_04442 [Thalassiosira oceanica]
MLRNSDHATASVLQVDALEWVRLPVPPVRVEVNLPVDAAASVPAGGGVPPPAVPVPSRLQHHAPVDGVHRRAGGGADLVPRPGEDVLPAEPAHDAAPRGAVEGHGGEELVGAGHREGQRGTPPAAAAAAAAVEARHHGAVDAERDAGRGGPSPGRAGGSDGTPSST